MNIYRFTMITMNLSSLHNSVINAECHMDKWKNNFTKKIIGTYLPSKSVSVMSTRFEHFSDQMESLRLAGGHKRHKDSRSRAQGKSTRLELVHGVRTKLIINKAFKLTAVEQRTTQWRNQRKFEVYYYLNRIGGRSLRTCLLI